MIRRGIPLVVGLLFVATPAPALAAELPVNAKVEAQPLGAQAQRVGEALEYLGSPLSAADKGALENAIKSKDAAAIQKVLDPHCIAAVRIGAANKMESMSGPAKPELMEQGWRVFLVKVMNDAGASQIELRGDSPNAAPLHVRSTSVADPKVTSVGEVRNRFMELEMFGKQPLLPMLSGLAVEYRVLQIYCRDAGRKEAKLGFSLQQHQLGGRPRQVAASNQDSYLFTSVPAVVVKLQVKDHDGTPGIGAFTFRDSQGRIYPAMSRRLAPDFFFHVQIYRKDGESVLLPPGKYTVSYTRGPEYLVLEKQITVPDASTHSESFDLKRWSHVAEKGYWSGDHHIHAAGCAHYESPTEGVTPEDMMRHVLGEDLNVGCCLSWGPCWYHQKRYFEGKTHPLSTPMHLLRYDVEVSGFPSSHAGHICLLRLKQQDYPGTKLIEDWPSWDLPIFKWAKSQGGVVGFAHSAHGLDIGPTRELPNYIVPPMNGIGANEYVVDVAHGMCDFISTVDTNAICELNIWYHTLNCGYRCRISGETDFPCIYGEKVGLGRSYVKLDGKLNFEDWCEGIKNGRSYVSDGKSHLLDFTVNGLACGTKGMSGEVSELRLTKADTVKVTAKVSAYLEPEQTPLTRRIRAATPNMKPYWDVERARVGDTRKVPVEVIVNGYPVAVRQIDGDGTEQTVEFDVPVKYSSWVALRVMHSSHTNPVFVLVEDKPIRASRRSANWCLKAIDACWANKSKQTRPNEKQAAKEAYDFATEAYKKVLAESVAD